MANTTEPLKAKLRADWRANLLPALAKREELQRKAIRRLRDDARNAHSEWAGVRADFDRDNASALKTVHERSKALAAVVKAADDANGALTAAKADASTTPEKLAELNASKVRAWLKRADAESDLDDARDVVSGDDPGTVEEYTARAVDAYESGIAQLERVRAVIGEVQATTPAKIEQGKAEVWAHARELNLSDIRR